MSYFPKPYSHNKNKTKVELDLSNYAPKSDLKSATGVNTSKFAKAGWLLKIKSDVDDLNFDKLNKFLLN